MNPDIAVMSTLIAGTNFKRARLGAAIQGNSFPSETTYYRHQKALIPKIEEEISTRLQSVAKSSFEEKNVHLSVDGRYDSLRNANNCSVTLMDCRKNQVLRIKNVNKEEEGVSSSLLESKCARYFFDETVKK